MRNAKRPTRAAWTSAALLAGAVSLGGLAGCGPADECSVGQSRCEGQQVLAEVREAAGADRDLHVLELPPDAHFEVNALQRAAT